MRVYIGQDTYIVTWEYVQIRNTGRYHTFCKIRLKGSVSDVADPGWAVQHRDDPKHDKEVGRRVSLTDALKNAGLSRNQRRVFWFAYWERGL